MIVRYQADADLNQAIVTGVLRREPTIDFQTAFAAGLAGVKDPEVLAWRPQRNKNEFSLVTTVKQCHQSLLRLLPALKVQGDHRF
ncbi:hypothetical protein LC593_04600 [Nostoc sp. CHAB 5844]|nr:hypothetical protein [Nostoc sp. CHAB 5844]